MRSWEQGHFKAPHAPGSGSPRRFLQDKVCRAGPCTASDTSRSKFSRFRIRGLELTGVVPHSYGTCPSEHEDDLSQPGPYGFLPGFFVMESIRPQMANWLGLGDAACIPPSLPSMMMFMESSPSGAASWAPLQGGPARLSQSARHSSCPPRP